MGKLDEHWCNICKRKLDKGKDEYIEFELVNAPFTAKLRGKKQKGILCEKCVKGSSELNKAVELMIKAGNPLFKAFISCESFRECETYEVSKNTRVNCAHICIISDTIYCNRSHLGILHLPQEVGEIERYRRQILREELQKWLKDPKIMQFMDTVMLQKKIDREVYVEPSTIPEVADIKS